MLRFIYENGHILDRETTERLSTMEQAVEKLNQLDILVDFSTEIEPSDESYSFDD